MSREASWKTVDRMFNRYTNKGEPDKIGPDGVEKLCRSLNIKVTDAPILHLAWKLKAAQQGFFTRQEWRKGMQAMGGVSSIPKLKAAIKALETELEESEELFKDYYQYAFRFNLMEPLHKTLDMDTACQMLEIVLAGYTHAESLIAFLKQQTEYAGLTMDQWLGILRFCTLVKPDLSNYDDDCSWPIVLDNYVSSIRASRNED